MSDLLDSGTAAPVDNPEIPSGADAGGGNDIDATMEAAYESAMAADEAPADSKPAPIRGEDGKFKSAAAGQTPAGSEAAKPLPAGAGDESPATAAVALDSAPNLEQPPASWRPAAKAKWDSLDPDVRAEAYKREQDFFNGIEQYKGKAGAFDRLAPEIEPYRALITAAGTDVPGAVRALFGTAAALQTGSPAQKAATLRGLAQQYGVDLGALTDGATPDSQGFVDPQISALQAEINSLKQHLNGQHQQSQDAQVREAWGAIQEFGSRPENRYFENVRPLMGTLMKSGQAATLQAAYDMACHAHPEVRKALATEQGAAAERDRQAKAAEAAAKARRAGSLSGRQTPSAVKSIPVGQTIEQTLEAAYEAAISRT